MTTDNVTIHTRLAGDLSAELDVSRKCELELENIVRQAAVDLKIGPNDNFTEVC